MLDDDLGVDVTCGSVTGRGMLDIANVMEDHNGVQYAKRVTTLLVATGDFDLSTESTLTADGTNYRIDSAELQDDGKLTLVILSRRS